ncbi:MAG: 30S ribosomal protein S6 [Candidatus Omnitrophica bacterium]|nr:30S ribosomal protein S6 [Candidatus Omnitrophota bacterium]MBU2063703.1 30S ribosomal protein S6 [Candidatus Omnitrophota bacterium]
MNTYEAVVLVRANLDKEKQEKIDEDIQGVITKNKGQIGHFDNWGKRKLAYTLSKQNEALYYFIEFDILPQVVAKIENAYKLKDEILRVLIVRKES